MSTVPLLYDTFGLSSVTTQRRCCTDDDACTSFVISSRSEIVGIALMQIEL